MKLYNTLSRTKEPLSPPAKDTVRLFVCGPTVYDKAHIGHARTYLAYDAFVKFLKNHLQWEVTYLQNITDIDDKIIARAQEEKTTWDVVAKKNTEAYMDSMQSLGIDSVDIYAPASRYIPEIVSQVERLIEKGNAYHIEDDGYYFDITTRADYGKLSGRSVEQAEDAVSRIDESINKRNRGDFALWKFSKKDEPGWDTALGYGRPGWHIEDTAITEKHFGAQYDIHGGGRELVFPHHEAEIAQMESLSGKTPMVQIWMHTGLVTIDGEKMAKSKGNFVTVDALLEHYSPHTFRMFIFSHHYRSPIDYSEGALKEAHARLARIASLRDRLATATPSTNEAAEYTDAIAGVWDALEDDFNTPEALARLFALASSVHKKLDTHNLSKADTQQASSLIADLDAIFGILPPAERIPDAIADHVAQRETYRNESSFKEADAIREELRKAGWHIEDTPEGPRVYKQ